MSALDEAIKNLRAASDAELKKLYLKKAGKAPDEEEEAKSEESELSDEDAELLQTLLK